MPKHRRPMPNRRRLALLSGTTILALGVASAVIVDAASGTADPSGTITVQASADATSRYNNSRPGTVDTSRPTLRLPRFESSIM